MLHTRIHAFLTPIILLACLFAGTVTAATLPLTVTGFNSLAWIVTNTGGSNLTAFTGDCDGSSAGMGISEATSANGATDAFDNAYQLYVDGVIFEAPADVDLKGETLTAGPVVLSGLNVTLEILFSGSVQAARIRAIFDNPTNVAITVNVDVPVNLGSDTDTQIEQTASGDKLFTEDDRWIVTSDNNVGPDAVNTTVIYGPGTPDVTPLAPVTRTVCNDSKAQPEGIGFSFSITIPANKTRSLMFFAGLGSIQGSNNTVTSAIANAATFNSNNAIDTRLLLGLSDTELLEILNWDFVATVNAAAVAAAEEEDRTFIDDFIGCSVSNSKTNDPTFLLLVLFAFLGLGRKIVLSLRGTQ